MRPTIKETLWGIVFLNGNLLNTWNYWLENGWLYSSCGFKIVVVFFFLSKISTSLQHEYYQMFTLIIAHQEYWRGLLFSDAFGRFSLYINLDVTELCYKKFAVINNMLQSCVPEQLQELILSRYLHIKGAMYSGCLPRILLKLQYWRLYPFSLLAVFLVSLLINLFFSYCLSVSWKHWTPKTFVCNTCYNTTQRCLNYI